MSPYRYHERAGLVIIALALLAGCTKPGIETTQAKEEDPMHCRDQCIRASIDFAAGELGLDPAEVESVPKESNLQKIFTALRSRSKSATGRLESLPLERFLQEIEGKPVPPTILVHESGHLSCVLGKINRDEKPFYQLIHGNTEPYLFSASQLKQARFRDAWIVKRDHFNGVPVRVGSGTVRISSLWHTFGEVHPFADEVTHFVITNDNKQDIVLDKPKTSCGCAVADFGNTKSLRPGQSVKMKVTVQTGGVPSMKQRIWLQFFERPSGISRRVELRVFAFQRQSMVVSPTELDFGKIIPSNRQEKINRIVRLAEVSTDRFRLGKIDVGALPIEYTTTQLQSYDGLTTYRVMCALKPEGRHSGEHSGVMQIHTSSALRPTIFIPVHFCIRPHVTATPETITFGTPEAGILSEQRFRLIPTVEGESIVVSILTAPKECLVSPSEEGKQQEYVVKARFKDVGVWEGVIKLQIKSASWSEIVEIKCVAYVRRAQIT